MSTNPKRLEFHLARKATNGFHNTLPSDPKKSQHKQGSVVCNKTSHSLFDPDIVASNMVWSRICRVGPGLFNLGNTCYLNSTLQCLLYIPALSQILLNESKNDPSVSGFNDVKFVTHQFRRVVIEAWSPSPGKSISPRGLVQNIRRIGKQFRPTRQEDAHEFLRQLLDCMHEEVLKSLRIKLTDRRVIETTFICRIFGGYLRNELRCPKCSYSSKTSNHFQDLSLELPNGIKSVKEAINAFVRPEKLTAGNEWKCDGCKQKVQASKQMTISKPPRVLVLHLKRFSFGNMFGKINRHIIFSLLLDLPCSEEDTTTVKYECTGVLVHHGGSSHSGHYVAFVKAPNGQWYEMDDNRVTVRSEAHVLQQHAYILFYSRVSKTPTGSTGNARSAVAPSAFAQPSLSKPPTQMKHVNLEPKVHVVDKVQIQVPKAENRTGCQDMVSAGGSARTAEKEAAIVSEVVSKLHSSEDSDIKHVRLRQRRSLLPMRFEGSCKRIKRWKAKILLKAAFSKMAVTTKASVAPDRARQPQPRDAAEVSPLSSSQPLPLQGLKQAPANSDSPHVSLVQSQVQPTALVYASRGGSGGTDVSARILHESRRGREVGGEGFWEDIDALEAQKVQALVTQQRREAQQVQQAKRPSQWDRQLDQGRVKKVKIKVYDDVTDNKFQAVQEQRNSDKGKQRASFPSLKSREEGPGSSNSTNSH